MPSTNWSDTTKRPIRLVTLGCKVNQYETQFVKEALEANGYREAHDGEPAELCVVNTCTVTNEGDAKSRQIVRRMHQHNPEAAIVVMGCYATRDPQAVSRLPGVQRVITDKERLGEELRDFGVRQLPSGIKRFDGHTRAFVKVQDGCLLNCTFCIIPKVRPTMSSRSPEEIIAEIAKLVEGGCREIVLTGIHLGHYGIDLSRGRPKDQWCRLWHLLRRIDGLPGDFRVRLSSLEAAEARQDLVQTMSSTPRIMPHLHLCLQSGSDRILRQMRRRYTSGGFIERCRRLRDAIDEPALTTDVIVGFPGETDEDFAATCKVVEEVGFSKVHIFPFSARKGTPAADYPNQIPPSVIAERRSHLQRVEQKSQRSYFQSLLGRTLEVLAERADPQRPGHVMGTSCRYATVSFPGYADAVRGQLIPVTAISIDNGVLVGDPEPPRDVTQRLRLPTIHHS